MLRISENPAVLWPVSAFEETTYGPWWVAHVKSRQEKALAWFLRDNDLPYFLPLRLKSYVQNGKRRKSLVPLFPGYLFFRARDEGRYTALTSNRIAQVIEVIEQQQLTEQLDRIHRAVASGEPVDTHPQLRQGARVRVTSGALMGVEGIVIRKPSVTKILLDVDILCQAAAVEIDPDFIEAIGEVTPVENCRE